MFQPSMTFARHWAALLVASLIGAVECVRLAHSRLADAVRDA